jgi:enamine deaminase RidA (YjgF/YER057c/UK114 family)
MKIEEKLKQLGITLSGMPKPAGAYVPCVRTGNLLFISGMLPLRDGKIEKSGSVGADVSFDEACGEARRIIINTLSVLKSEVGDLDRISRCVKMNGYVSSAPDFHDQHKVMNTASDLLFEIFGDGGRHARSAIGVNALPLNVVVEIDFVFEVAAG